MDFNYDRQDYTDKDFDWDDSHLSDEDKSRAETLRQRGNVKVTTNVKEDTKQSIKSSYVLAFTENLELFAEMDITKNQLRVCTYMLNKMEYGNLVSLNQTAVSKNLDLAKSTVSRVFKQLKKKSILVEDDDGNTFVNSNLFLKGIPHRLKKDKRDNLNSARCDTVFSDSYNFPRN